MPCTCAVWECTNRRKEKKLRKEGLLFHRFPVKSPSICRLWMEKCRRTKGELKPENSRICSDHFTEDDYEGNLRSRLLRCPQRKTLKATAVPSVFPGRLDYEREARAEGEGDSKTDRNRVRKKEETRRLGDSRQVGLEIERIIANNEDSIRRGSLKVRLFSMNRNRSAPTATQSGLASTNHLHSDEETLKKIVSKQRKEILRLHGIICALKSKTIREKTTAKLSKEKTLKNVKKIFSKTQIRSLSGKKVNWTKDDVKKAMLVQDVSSKAYEIVLNTWKLPLPAVRTLRTWSKFFRDESETIESTEEPSSS